jgi:23S rRNA (adenine2030-N6)-methyltransferase
MNYRHTFHAGNFADVFKHAVLVRLLKALQKKNKGFAYIETHAGPGRYDLKAPEPQKTGEYRDGIGRLWDSQPDGIEDYLAAVRTVNRGKALRYYPGSPRIARFFLRPQDRMRLCEAEPDECERLRAEFTRERQVEVRCGDGYAALKAWLPPPERRGLVLIDPPYESNEEWRHVRDAVLFAVDRWPSGIYAVWYPRKAGAPVESFKAGLAAAGIRRIYMAELDVWTSDVPFRLNGSGVLIVNAPWQIEQSLSNLCKPLTERLKQGPSSPLTRFEWLVPE